MFVRVFFPKLFWGTPWSFTTSLLSAQNRTRAYRCLLLSQYKNCMHNVPYVPCFPKHFTRGMHVSLSPRPKHTFVHTMAHLSFDIDIKVVNLVGPCPSLRLQSCSVTAYVQLLLKPGRNTWRTNMLLCCCFKNRALRRYVFVSKRSRNVAKV
jgi:hypothetical protein